MRSIICSLALSFALAGSLPARAQMPPAADGPIPVETIIATRRPVAQPKDFVGRIEAVNRVEVRARVVGFLDKVAFREGGLVKQGTLLYRIEPEQFVAAVRQAEGVLYRTQAISANAAIERHRADVLVSESAIAEEVRDQRVAEEKSAQGDVITAEANLRIAQFNLGYTEITSPIDGIIGRTSLTAGNLVGPSSGVLTTIVSQDPVYVVFPVSHRDFLRMKRREIEAHGENMHALLRFSDGSTYDKPARLNFLGVTVSKSTDTITLRGVVPNPNAVLVDGQLVRVAVLDDKPEQKVLVPQFALIADQQGTYVFIVQDGKAVVRRVQISGVTGPYAIVDSGLSGGEQVVAQGGPLLRPGDEVTPSPVPPSPGR
jgi:membrane fusion protein, multidrug efflux system